MNLTARVIYYFGLISLGGAIVLALNTGKTRREFFVSDFSEQMPFWMVLLLGLALAQIGRKLARNSENKDDTTTPRSSNAETVVAPVGAPKPEAKASAPDPEPVEPDMGTDKVQLQLMVPPGPSESWIGGQPRLPNRQRWPMIKERPAQFIAQICLDDLPEGIWGGLGPKTGWFAIFAQPGESSQTRVLHFTDRGKFRVMPGSQEESGAPTSIRWPLRVNVADAERAHDRASALAQFNETLRACSPTGLAWEPFDWPSIRLYLGKCRELIDLRLNPPMAARNQHRLSNADTELLSASAREALAVVDELTDLADALSDQGDLTPEVRENVMDILKSLQWTYLKIEDGKPHSIARAPMMSLPFFSSLGEAFEQHARAIYAANPKNLPRATRAVLQPHWARLAQTETAYMGGEIPDTYAQAEVRSDRTVVILDVPSSTLVGHDFGENARLGMFLTPRQMRVGKPSRAIAVTTHGLE